MLLRSCGMRVILLVVAAAVVAVVPARAGDWPVVPPEELTMTSEPLAPGAPAIILYRQVDHRDDDVHRPYETSYYRIKILTEEGRKYADVRIPYVRDTENVFGIEARTIQPDGSIVKFDGKVSDKAGAKADGEPYVAKTFTLPDVHVGSIIEYRYGKDWEEYELYDSHWTVSDDLFTKHARFSLMPYTEQTYTCHWIWRGLPNGSEAPKQDPRGVVRLELQNIPAFPQEEYAPPENALKARVDFIYSEKIETDPNKYWKQEGKQLDAGVEGYVNKRAAMTQAVGQIVGANDAPEVKLRKIYEHVRQMRNLSYDKDTSGQKAKRGEFNAHTKVLWDSGPGQATVANNLSESHSDYLKNASKMTGNAEKTWKLGYGDKPELDWLFLGLVRAAGFEAWPVKVAARNEYLFDPKTLNVQQLNENAVLVKLNGQELFFNPGEKFVPYGLLPWEETGVTGLRLDNDGGDWTNTPLPPSSASRTTRKAELKLDDAGTVQGNLTVTYSGNEASSRRQEEFWEDATARKKFLEDEVKGWIPATSEVELKNMPDWDSSAETLVAEFALKVPGWAVGTKQRTMVPVALFGGSEKHIFESADRLQDVSFQFPYERTDDITIALPTGWQVGTLPPAQKIDSGFCGYALQAEDKKGTLHLTREFAIHGVWLPRQYYGALRVFYQTVRAEDKLQIVLLPGTVDEKK